MIARVSLSLKQPGRLHSLRHPDDSGDFDVQPFRKKAGGSNWSPHRAPVVGAEAPSGSYVVKSRCTFNDPSGAFAFVSPHRQLLDHIPVQGLEVLVRIVVGVIEHL